jgi:S-adenosylmethionine:tRNA ribosyltransferase-isomerase
VPQQRLKDSWIVEFQPPGNRDVREFLPRIGEVPLPPYIHQSAGEERYQTVYARTSGTPWPLDSAAAPTAGLHFTPRLLEELAAAGVASAFVTLAVGIGTFRPVQTAHIEEHEMHQEEFLVPEATATAINDQHRRGGRVVAVGTTTVRTLESAVDANGQVAAVAGATRIFIKPGFHFRAVDALITNFHLPRSTLLAMVGAFIQDGGNPTTGTGIAALLNAYAEAIALGYRFYSIGDAMLIE